MSHSLYLPPPSYDSIHQPNARTPLTTTITKARGSLSVLRTLCAGLVVILISLFLAQNLGLVRCPLNDVSATEKAELRRQWDFERNAHQIEITKWVGERGEHAAELRTWERERGVHAAEVRGWEQERAARREERKEEEHHRLEVVRQSQGVYWTEPYADWRCHAYGTRIYTATLQDIPRNLNWREVCDNMPPVVIHGRNVSKPYKCERSGHGETIGTWYINFDEPSCTPYWAEPTDLGCILGHTGFQRIAARLDGMSNGADGEMMCSTTPATIHGVHFNHPTTCENRGRWGMVGIWDLPNRSCL